MIMISRFDAGARSTLTTTVLPARVLAPARLLAGPNGRSKPAGAPAEPPGPRRLRERGGRRACAPAVGATLGGELPLER